MKNTYVAFGATTEAQQAQIGLNTNENYLLRNNTFVVLSDLANNWEAAIDAVDYPVEIVDAFYRGVDGEFTQATGETDTGRDTEFKFIAVDRERTGDFQVISCVTDTYGTVKTSDIYESLREQLAETGVAHTPNLLYVSKNGGRQILYISMDALDTGDKIPDKVNMNLVVNTSVDGKTKHSISLVAHNETSGVKMQLPTETFNLAARHTSTLGDRTVNFIPAINTLIENWAEYIVPVMVLMFEKKFDREAAIELLVDTAKEAGMAERHQKKVRDLYTSDRVRTKAEDDSVYRIMTTLNQYVDDEMGGKVNLQERTKMGIAKSVSKLIEKM